RIEKTDGDDLQPMSFERHDPIICQDLRLGAGSQHEWHVWAVDVSIEQANFMAELRQCDRQVHCQRGFAHATFAGADGDNRFHSGQRLRRRRLLAGRSEERRVGKEWRVWWWESVAMR